VSRRNSLELGGWPFLLRLNITHAQIVIKGQADNELEISCIQDEFEE
jgi:hypothetical protein